MLLFRINMEALTYLVVVDEVFSFPQILRILVRKFKFTKHKKLAQANDRIEPNETSS